MIAAGLMAGQAVRLFASVMGPPAGAGLGTSSRSGAFGLPRVLRGRRGLPGGAERERAIAVPGVLRLAVLPGPYEPARH
jgi:hypothetical protein